MDYKYFKMHTTLLSRRFFLQISYGVANKMLELINTQKAFNNYKFK